MLSAKDEAVRQEVTNRYVYVIMPYLGSYYAIKHDKSSNTYHNDRWGAGYVTMDGALQCALSDWEVPDEPIIHHLCWRKQHERRGRK